MNTGASRNRGEESEVFFKAFLVKCYQKKIPLFGVHGIGLITALNFGPRVKIPKWKDKYDLWLQKKDYNALKKIFGKSRSTNKADVGINGINYSVKSSIGARSALVNHTPRKGFMRVCETIHCDIRPLDKMIQQYWAKRSKGEIGEDIKNSDLNSPFKNSKDYFRPIFEYFLFKGTGSSDSKFPADKLLIIGDPCSPESYKIVSPNQIIDELWDDMVFSIRRKGMPKKYDPVENTILTPWVGYTQESDSPLGSLHIRH